MFEAISHERRIALPWLTRLRWLAVVGQIGATALGATWLKLELPIGWIALVISVTALSNLILQIWHRVRPVPDWITPALLLLDVCALTVLLFLTGGTSNPFSALYAIHVAMAVVTLGMGWALLIAVIAAIAYGAMFFWFIPLHPQPSNFVGNLGQWSALGLVVVLSAYFIGHVMRSLRDAERELANSRERARHHQHLAALTTLAAGAAHELGTPLSTIALVAKEIERSVNTESMTADDARLIRQEVERCRAILDRMRVDVLDDASQRDSFETIDAFVEQVKSDLPAKDRDRLIVETAEPHQDTIDRARVLRRAIGVLLRNAFDASPEDATVKLHLHRSNGSFVFEVRDSGNGMSDEVLRRAGEPFFTTKAPGEGMGLGLFLVRLVADTYGGRFELKSSTGSGTRSILELPDRMDHVEGPTIAGGVNGDSKAENARG